MGVGKSTLAQGLAGRLELPRCSVDRIQWEYFPGLGFDHELAKRLLRYDQTAFLNYSAPFMLSALERALTEHPRHVIDFGAGHAAYDDPAQVQKFKAMLAPFTKVLLLMPAPDPATSIRLLPGPASGLPMNPYFIRHPLKNDVATKVIVTGGRAKQKVLEEAFQWVIDSDD